MYKVLFVCIHNAARSQMAEAYLSKFGSKNFIAESAGIEQGKLNQRVVAVLKEDGIDISQNETKSVFDLFVKGNKYDVVITVCDAASAERCPVFPGKVKRLAWSFSDPSAFEGTEEEILNKTREVREKIKAKVQDFIKEASQISYWIH